MQIEGIYIDQLARVALAIDYDGPMALNPRYWHYLNSTITVAFW